MLYNLILLLWIDCSWWESARPSWWTAQIIDQFGWALSWIIHIWCDYYVSHSIHDLWHFCLGNFGIGEINLKIILYHLFSLGGQSQVLLWLKSPIKGSLIQQWGLFIQTRFIESHLSWDNVEHACCFKLILVYLSLFFWLLNQFRSRNFVINMIKFWLYRIIILNLQILTNIPGVSQRLIRYPSFTVKHSIARMLFLHLQILRIQKLDFINLSNSAMQPNPLKCRFLAIYSMALFYKTNGLQHICNIIKSSYLRFKLLFFLIFTLVWLFTQRDLLCRLFQTDYVLPGDEQVDKLLAQYTQAFFFFVSFKFTAVLSSQLLFFLIRLQIYKTRHDLGRHHRNLVHFFKIVISIQIQSSSKGSHATSRFGWIDKRILIFFVVLRTRILFVQSEATWHSVFKILTPFNLVLDWVHDSVNSSP